MTEPSVQPPPPPNWYADPLTPGLERWWTGSAWSDLTHPAARNRRFSPAGYTRSFWVGANTLAGRAYLIGRIGLSIALLGIVFAVLVYLVFDPTHSRPWGLVMLITLVIVAIASVPLGILATVWASVAISRASRLGALGLAVMAIRVGIGSLALGLVVAAVLLLAVL